jgi:tRNA(Leu) C34 or U34 (ribose-2'-O)-methylase TrmL
MLPSADDKKYATDTREFIDAVNQDNIFNGKLFTNSPVMENVPIKDICIYRPGDLNKIGKEGRTSWDSFSYAIMMGHNVWQHVNSVQEANRQYDAGLCPAMLVDEKFDQVFFKDVVEAIFATSDRSIADTIVEEYSKFWMAIPGTRGATGKRTINTSTTFANLFDVVEEDPVKYEEDDVQDESKLDELEESVK